MKFASEAEGEITLRMRTTLLLLLALACAVSARFVHPDRLKQVCLAFNRRRSVIYSRILFHPDERQDVHLKPECNSDVFLFKHM